MIRRFAATAFRTGSWAEITGSTDRLGEQQYNTDLSQRRANAVRNIILGFQPQAKILSTRGVGASVLPYDNNFPEGRYYCRTVSILVKTPR
jgi:outer membrane protein OmpA-like peptidoglycan-associated protein